MSGRSSRRKYWFSGIAPPGGPSLILGLVGRFGIDEISQMKIAVHPRRLKRFLPCALAILLPLLSVHLPREADATEIHFQLTDLADTVPAQDLWQASFTLSQIAFMAGQGFTVFFDPIRYGMLSAVLSAPAGWNVLTVQPDPILNAPGFLDGLALANNSSLAFPFVLNFVWLGAGAPGSQAFQIYDQNAGFQIIESGQTIVGGPTGVVPETGGSSLLLGLSFFLVVIAQRRIARRSALALVSRTAT